MRPVWLCFFTAVFVAACSEPLDGYLGEVENAADAAAQTRGEVRRVANAVRDVIHRPLDQADTACEQIVPLKDALSTANLALADYQASCPAYDPDLRSVVSELDMLAVAVALATERDINDFIALSESGFDRQILIDRARVDLLVLLESLEQDDGIAMWSAHANALRDTGEWLRAYALELPPGNQQRADIRVADTLTSVSILALERGEAATPPESWPTAFGERVGEAAVLLHTAHTTQDDTQQCVGAVAMQARALSQEASQITLCELGCAPPRSWEEVLALGQSDQLREIDAHTGTLQNAASQCAQP